MAAGAARQIDPDHAGLIDFDAINAAALKQYPDLLAGWLPGGSVHGAEYQCGDATGGPGHSFSVNIRTGVWKEFAGGPGGSDPVSLYAHILGLSMRDAARQLAAEIGIETDVKGPSKADRRNLNEVKKSSTWKPIVPVPEDAPPTPETHFRLGKYRLRWRYTKNGRLWGYTARFDKATTRPNGKPEKEVLPLVFCEDESGRRSWRWQALPEPRLLYGLGRLERAVVDTPAAVVEGEKARDAAQALAGDKFVCVTWPGGSGAVEKADWSPLKGRRVLIWPDADMPGFKCAIAVARALGGIASSISILVPDSALPEGWDLADAEGWDRNRFFNEIATCKRDHESFLLIAKERYGIESARSVAPEPGAEAHQAADTDPEPMALPDGLPAVAPFEMALLPETLRPWAADIIERMQCPPDFVAVAAVAALGAVIGRRIGIRPQGSTDWTVTPNQWGMLIGRPGVLKSPAMEAALNPVKRLAALAVERYQAEAADYQKQSIAEKLRAEAAEKAARAALAKDPGADLSRILDFEKTEPPTLARYLVNDGTAAALGELHRQNPNGLLVFRDELVSLLRSLDQEENSEARGFYLTGWNGDSAYTFDRITRGMNLHIPAVCLSLLGSTQPARIASYVKGAVTGTGGDGLLQRFGMIVWPDTGANWEDVDRWPDNDAKRKAHQVFERLARMDPFILGAKQDVDPDGNPEGIPYLRFDPAGLGLFREWRQDLEARLRSGDLHPAFESHLAKYRKLVPGLALICHLAEGASGPVGRPAVLRALAWAEYMETHARRLYASVAAPDAATARAIVAKIRSGALLTVLTVRDIYRPQWTGLTDLETIKAGVKLLVDRDWLIEARKDTGGRPSFEYRLNPKTDGLR